MTIAPFGIARLPRIQFGRGAFNLLPELISSFGNKLLLITGKRSFLESPRHQVLLDALNHKGTTMQHAVIASEPSPTAIDDLVQRYYASDIQVVVAIGGGSVIDAGKAVAGLLPFGNSVLDHLEGVGNNIPYAGLALPFIAVPTTAGTGSEATKNAVLSHHGNDGYKKSFRHDALVPEIAVVDPDLLDTCPPSQIAANGMDAFTQLLESFVSANANPVTDALAISGMTAIRDGFIPAWTGGRSDAANTGREAMAYGALLSGITLAQAGLGAVHGLAAPLGAFFPIPHGVVCGVLLVEATRANLEALTARQPDSSALSKYGAVGRLLARDETLNTADALAALLQHLDQWQQTFALPRLGALGVNKSDLTRIVANSRGNSMLTNPILLTDAEIANILAACL